MSKGQLACEAAAAILVFCLLLGAGVAGAKLTVAVLPDSSIGIALAFVVALVSAFYCMLAVGEIGERVVSWRRGYRVRCVMNVRMRAVGVRSGDRLECFYEELAPGSQRRRIALLREAVGRKYPVDNRVWMPSEAEWDERTPQWALGRRAEIAQRIAEELGSAIGAKTVFETEGRPTTRCS